MRYTRLIVISLVLFVGNPILTLGLVPLAAAADKDLSEADIYKMESGSKDFVIDLIAAGVWKKDGDEYKLFAKYDAKKKFDIPRFDEKERKFLENDTFPITGAEYRRALVAVKALAPVNYNKLDDDGKKRVNTEIFGQETKPEKGTDAYKAGIDRVKHLVNIIGGEAYATASVKKPASQKQ